jgi:hypothetical protein
MAVADDGKDSGQSGNFIRRALRIAAGDDDASLRIAPLDAANVSAGVAIGFRGDGAGVDNHHIGRRRGTCRTDTESFQPRGNRISVGLAGAAAEVFHVVSCHPASVTIAATKNSDAAGRISPLQIDNPT